MLLKSFSLGYALEEDRLLLSVNAAQSSHDYWLTRRGAAMLAEVLQKMISKQYALLGSTANMHCTTHELAEFGQSTALEKFPLTASGDTRLVKATLPLLLSKVRYQVIDAQITRIALIDKSEQGFTYQVSRELLHALLNLLQSQCNQASWQLNFSKSSNSVNPNDRFPSAIH
jgi:hypothetical protein